MQLQFYLNNPVLKVLQIIYFVLIDEITSSLEVSEIDKTSMGIRNCRTVFNNYRIFSRASRLHALLKVTNTK